MKNKKLKIGLLAIFFISGCVSSDKKVLTKTKNKDLSVLASDDSDLYGLWANHVQDKDMAVIIMSKFFPDKTGTGILYFLEKKTCTKITTNFSWSLDNTTNVYTQVDNKTIKEETGKAAKDITDTKVLRGKVKLYKLGNEIAGAKFLGTDRNAKDMFYRKMVTDEAFDALLVKDVNSCFSPR